MRWKRYIVGLLMCLLSVATGAREQATEESNLGDLRIVDEIIVTASRKNQEIREVPSSVTVISNEQLQHVSTGEYGDLLGSVPGLNVAQLSARDVNVSARQATRSLASDQLVLLDGRTLYLDFLGFVMWDFVPLDPQELERIEVVRGPSSAVWGSNALTGVIHMITKSPWEQAGTRLTLGGGEVGRVFGSLVHAKARGRSGFKISSRSHQQNAFARPSGFIPETSTPYPEFENSGTVQSQVDLRVDFRARSESLWSLSSGWAETDGLLYSGIGPFDIDRGSALAYLKTSWSKGNAGAHGYVNYLDGDASNLLILGDDGLPLQLAFESLTYNFEVSGAAERTDRLRWTYGLTARRSNYRLSIAPEGKKREEAGVFLQSELSISDRAKWVAGVRWDHFDLTGSVISPRVSFLASYPRGQKVWASYGEAFRTPSVIEDSIDVSIVTQALVDPTDISAAIAPGTACERILSSCEIFALGITSEALGSNSLDVEALQAFEVGYGAKFGRINLSASVYRNELRNRTSFAVKSFYDRVNPPGDWPIFLHGGAVPVVPPDVFPSTFQYRNSGKVIYEGLDLSVKGPLSKRWSLFGNVSFQERVFGGGNTPPKHRWNLGLNYSGQRGFAYAKFNYTSRAFWRDILDDRFNGPTDAFTRIGVGCGVYLLGDKLTLSLRGSNVLDERVQQHVFGDIISRVLTAQVSISL